MAGVSDVDYIDVSYGLEKAWTISKNMLQSHKYNYNTSLFEKLVDKTTDQVDALALGPKDDVWMILSDNSIKHFAIKSNQWTTKSNKGIDIAVGSEGSVYILNDTATSTPAGSSSTSTVAKRSKY